MNYLRELNAFFDWLETNPLDSTTQSLWFHLMAINNRCGWQEWFAVANLTLQAKLRVNKNTIIKHRNILIQKGRIEYRKSGRQEVGRYRVIRFDELMKGDTGVNNTPVRKLDCTPGPDLNRAPLIKLNETKTNPDNIYGDFVLLTPGEHAELVRRLGERETEDWIERLNSFAHQKPTRFSEYASHYHTILNWSRREGDVQVKKRNSPKERDRNYGW